MEGERYDNGDYCYFHPHQEVDRAFPDHILSKTPVSSSTSLPRPTTPPLPSSCSTAGGSDGVGAGFSYIEHRVSKMDTLAGVAIKYGVEVADIKRINGLVTDLQMFALKTLQIPLPGRHPPSHSLSNDLDNEGRSEENSVRRRHSDLFESFQSLRLKSSPQWRVSPAMSSLQGYYGLKKVEKSPDSEGFEMAVYRKGGSHYLEDVPFSQSPLSNPPLSHHRKCRSVANGFSLENSELADSIAAMEGREVNSDKGNEKLIRRRQKSEADFTRTPEMLLKEDSSSGGGFSSITGKGLALRPKAASRTASGMDMEAGQMNPIPIGLGDSLVSETLNGVRKSSSTSSLQDQENAASSSSIWPTSKWNLKPDLQALSSAAITRPIFDGLPKPITGWRNKAALD
ncbi:hypothetical protein NMG60_11024215 [Bertholletia excelsa]